MTTDCFRHKKDLEVLKQMLSSRVTTWDRGPFALKAVHEGEGPLTMVLGSHVYYPRTFSQSLKKQLNFTFLDTRGFVPTLKQHQPEDFTLEHIIQDMEAVRQSLKIDKMILMGHSIHVFMALEYARRFPDHVSRLVLLASSPIMGPEVYQASDAYFQDHASPERKQVFAQRMATFAASNDGSFVRRMLAFGPRLWYDPHFDASWLWENVEVNEVGANLIWGSMFADYDTRAALQAIRCPIFLGLGRCDYFNPPQLWDSYEKEAKDMAVHIFEKSGHTPQLEESDVFDACLLGWIHQSRGAAE